MAFERSNMTDQAWTGDWDQPVDTNITVEQLDEMVADYQRKRDVYEAAKRESSDKYKELAEAESKLQETLKAMGKKSYKLEGVGTFTRVMKEVVKTPKTNDDKTQLFEWIKQNHGPDVLMSMVSINHQTLNSFYREEAKRAEDPAFKIPGVEAPTSVENVSFRKA